LSGTNYEDGQIVLVERLVAGRVVLCWLPVSPGPEMWQC